ncbi:hypothetical protein SDRG_15364 [Saprolegnia diclina VS20]|uniref:Pentacotripeptide-repeat region of PRORP domain-containing protein n=1 Tax=Saprolegnia diclina (strain VS20) TaxID=1156394 RepID=T0PN62_SAPDV|nr:hypothetical protein SDRG_15364 [Saprolegnia diclina VS20]EQC26854.1 hypothetical protein SDRG_15364 [Saprolegnia diclina VS20]|eukprot:XP_008619756.1 hypothetical protein SDRG_15364 [Saprolegnia diclina VS20]
MLARTSGRCLRLVAGRPALRRRFLHATAISLQSAFSVDDCSPIDLLAAERLQMAQSVLQTTTNDDDLGVVSDVLLRLSMARDVARAKTLVELMHENDVLATAPAMRVFSRSYFREHAKDLPSALQWYLENHKALLSPTQELPLQDVLVHLVAQGQAAAAIEFWLLWSETLLELPIDAIAALLAELVRYEQYETVIGMLATKHKESLQQLPAFHMAHLEALVGLRKYSAGRSLLHELRATNAVPYSARLKELAALCRQRPATQSK